MTNLEAIGTSHQAVSLRGDAKPVVREQKPESERPVEKDEKAEKPEARPQAKRVETPTRAYSARLNYDEDEKEVIIEILDPQTGDVLQRFPAKELPDDLRAAVGGVGSLVETTV